MSHKYSYDPPYNPPYMNRKSCHNAEKQNREPGKQDNVSSVNKSEVAMVRCDDLFLRFTCPLCQNLFDDATTIIECMHTCRKRMMIIERDPLVSTLTCPLCEHIFEEATTIILCLHTFCRKCITEKLQEEENCPVCDRHLGVTPTDKIRPDHSIQSLRKELFPPKSTESDQGSKSESVPHAEPAVETERAESISSTEVNDSPHKPTQTRHHHKKGGKKKGSAHHGPGPVINEPMVEKKGEVKEEIEQAPHEVDASSQSLKERESTDTSELEKPLNNLALEPDTSTDHDAKGKEVEMPPPDNKGKGKRKGKKERNGAGSSGTTNTVATGTGTGTGTGTVMPTAAQPERKFTNVWFTLVAFPDSNCSLILPQIFPNMIRIKDGNMTVSSVQKYLAKKLSLSNESEVEVLCQNLPVSPATSMYNLMDLWLETRPKQKIRATVDQSGAKFMMALQYRRAKNN